MDAGRPPIEAILSYQEDIMHLRSLDHVSFNENLRKKVPTDVLVNKISELNDNFAIQKTIIESALNTMRSLILDNCFEI